MLLSLIDSLSSQECSNELSTKTSDFNTKKQERASIKRTQTHTKETELKLLQELILFT